MSMIRLTALAALVALAPALPASAADLATIDCVSGKIQPGLREQIEEEVTRTFAGTALRPAFDALVSGGLRVAATSCAAEHGWSEAAATAARDYAVARISLPIAEKHIGEAGFDVAELEAQFAALPEETRNRQLTREEMQQLVIASVTDEAKQTRENATLLNRYFLMLSTQQSAAWDFSQA